MLLGVSRSSLYYEPRRDPAEDLELMRLIDKIHLNRPFLGRRRIVDELADQPVPVLVNHKRVQRLMRLMGISAIYRKPRTSMPGKGCEHRIFPYLLAGVEITRPNQVWCTDITFIPMSAGFCYLVAIMDVFSRKVLAWQLSNTMDTRFCVEVLEEAMARYGLPEVFNSDQGSQFTSRAFTGVLEARGVKISMDGRGRWIDNVFIERFWRSIKYECVYLHAFESVRDARRMIGEYIPYYNQRKHQSLTKQAPDMVYNQAVGVRLVPAAVHRKSGALTARPCS